MLSACVHRQTVYGHEDLGGLFQRCGMRADLGSCCDEVATYGTAETAETAGTAGAAGTAGRLRGLRADCGAAVLMMMMMMK